MKNQIPEITEILRPFSEFAFLLGSYGTERFGIDSDIDLAVFFNKSVDQKKHGELFFTLEDLTGRSIDLIDLRNIDPIFSRQVLETGRLLLDQNHQRLVEWQNLQIGKYLDFKMDRLGIEKNLLKRKHHD